MREKDEFELEDEPSFLGNIVVILMTVVILAVVAVGAYFLLGKSGGKDTMSKDVVLEDSSGEEGSSKGDSEGDLVLEEDSKAESGSPDGVSDSQESLLQEEQDPQNEANQTELSLGTETDIAELLTEADVEAMHNFKDVKETVTAKDATNLRNIPNQGEDSQVMLTLYNGQTATRTGVSDSGWSRVIYGGETYYAVSSYLTTDLTPPTPSPTEVPPEDDGIKTVFTARDEMVSPKIEVNLRTLPSVTNPESVVVVKLPYGSVVRRTGINTDVGWSRVEYEGQVLYCISSYVFVVE